MKLMFKEDECEALQQKLQDALDKTTDLQEELQSIFLFCKKKLRQKIQLVCSG